MRRVLLPLVLVMVIAACGAPAPATTPSPGTGSAFPVSISHKFGTTVIPAQPKRIVVLSFEEDALSLVGMTTVGHTDNAFEPGTPYPWQVGTVDLTGSVAVVGQNYDVNVERLAALRPDLILATNYARLDDVYPRLAAIAPTVAYAERWGLATWQENAALVGRAVGKEPEMAAAVAGLAARIDALGARLPGLRDKTFAGAYYYGPGQFRANTDPKGTGARLLGQLGMRQAPAFVGAVVDRGLSPERIDALESDFLQIGFGSPALQAQLQANPLYAGLAAVRDGRVFVGDNLTSTASNQPTLLSIPWLVQRWEPVLERTASR